MAIVETNPEKIDGPWVEGFVLDRHVIWSAPLGYRGEHMQFDTKRSALGELVYQLKYGNGKPDDIIETALDAVNRRWTGRVDCVVSPPPSARRRRQPVTLIAQGIAAGLDVPYKPNAAVKENATEQMKNVSIQERAPLLSSAIQAGSDVVVGMRVLLVDDLWETGSTLRRVADVLRDMGAAEIRAITMTRTK